MVRLQITICNKKKNITVNNILFFIEGILSINDTLFKTYYPVKYRY